MRQVPVDAKRSDWPRLVAQSTNRAALVADQAIEAAPSRAAVWFFQ